MPGKGGFSHTPRPVKVLRGIPDHFTYRQKLWAKWHKRGYQVRFA